MARPPKAREPLKQAALRLFVEQGVHATGIREIAKYAGCSEAALYRHWANKEALVASLYREHLEEVVALLDQAIASAKDIEGKVRSASRAAYLLYDEQPLVFRFVLLVQHELADVLDAKERSPIDVVVGLAKQAIAAGEAKGDAAILGAALVGVFLQTASFVLYGRIKGPLLDHADDVAKVAMRILSK